MIRNTCITQLKTLKSLFPVKLPRNCHVKSSLSVDFHKSSFKSVKLHYYEHELIQLSPLRAHYRRVGSTLKHKIWTQLIYVNCTIKFSIRFKDARNHSRTFSHTSAALNMFLPTWFIFIHVWIMKSFGKWYCLNVCSAVSCANVYSENYIRNHTKLEDCWDVNVPMNLPLNSDCSEYKEIKFVAFAWEEHFFEISFFNCHHRMVFKMVWSGTWKNFISIKESCTLWPSALMLITFALKINLSWNFQEISTWNCNIYVCFI